MHTSWGRWRTRRVHPLPAASAVAGFGLWDRPVQECSPNGGTFSDFSRTFKFSYVKLRHKIFGRSLKKHVLNTGGWGWSKATHLQV